MSGRPGDLQRARGEPVLPGRAVEGHRCPDQYLSLPIHDQYPYSVNALSLVNT